MSLFAGILGDGESQEDVGLFNKDSRYRIRGGELPAFEDERNIATTQRAAHDTAKIKKEKKKGTLGPSRKKRRKDAVCPVQLVQGRKKGQEATGSTHGLRTPSLHPLKRTDNKMPAGEKPSARKESPKVVVVASENEVRKKGKKRKAEITPENSSGALEDETEATLLDIPEVAGENRAVVPQVKRSPEEELERLSRTIFVGNLPIDATQKRLKTIFSQYGRIESLRFRSVPIDLDKRMPRRAAILSKKTAKDRGTSHAYIVFETQSSSVAALKHNMQEVDGLHIRVDRAAPPTGMKGELGSKAEYDRSCSIFVGNLPFDVEDEDVIKLFHNPDADESAAVAGVRIVRDAETNIGKGFGFVLFNSKAAAQMAIARDGDELKGRPIRVSRVAAVRRGGTSATAKQTEPSKPSNAPVSAKEAYARRKMGENATESSKSKKASAASWQGIQTKGANKAPRASAASAPPKRHRQASSGAPKPIAPQGKAPRQRIGKRPAVAARKAKALGQTAPKRLTKEQKVRRAKSHKYHR